MTSYQDIMIICSDFPVGKPLCMHIGTVMVCLHIHQHPHQNPKYYESSKPLSLFPYPFSMPVTLIYTMRYSLLIYVLVNRSILCNCRIEADNHYLFKSIAACDNKVSNLVMYFTINMAFTNYLDLLPNLTNPFQLIEDRTTYEQPLPINLSIPDFDNSLQHAPTNLKNFMDDYANNKEIFDLKERHASTAASLNNPNKNLFSNNYIVDIFMFTSSIISLISATLVVYLFVNTNTNTSSKLNIT